MTMVKSKPFLVVLALLILFQQTSKANANLVAGLPLIHTIVQIIGNLTCLENGQPLANAPIIVSAGTPTRTIVTGTTGPSGGVDVVANTGSVINSIPGLTDLLNTILVTVNTTNVTCPSLAGVKGPVLAQLVPANITSVSDLLTRVLLRITGLLAPLASMIELNMITTCLHLTRGIIHPITTCLKE